ncbi:DUF6894 family protein [Pararhizobium arenae]|uniref:DUF6894 family protein n=1 Tax=Pararhizobium arenae TaxID=1856850 RepID=UPI00094B3F64|nr:hypothetical protein [Pararhizobium arenae]
MPEHAISKRYFFDITNGDGFVADDTGLVLNEKSKVEEEATMILADIARDELPGKPEGNAIVDVRDEKGERVYSAALQFQKRWISAY